MPKTVVTKGSAVWKGDLTSGSGTAKLDTSGLGNFDMNWKARSEEAQGGTSSPEELIAAAHSTCFSMAFSNMLAQNNTPPTQIDTNAEVSFVAGTGITGIHLTTRAQIEGISDEDFQRIAEEAKKGCPVSQALAGTEITLTAELV